MGHGDDCLKPLLDALGLCGRLLWEDRMKVRLLSTPSGLLDEWSICFFWFFWGRQVSLWKRRIRWETLETETIVFSQLMYSRDLSQWIKYQQKLLLCRVLSKTPAPRKQTDPPENWCLEDGISFWNGPFFGGHLFIFGGVSVQRKGAKTARVLGSLRWDRFHWFEDVDPIYDELLLQIFLCWR